MSRFATVTLALLAAGVWFTATRTGAGVPHAKGDAAKAPTKAICVMTPLSGSKVHGVVTFTVKGDNVVVKGRITGLTPGLHGFHVHEFGDLTSAKDGVLDGLSTGGHFNPEGKMHGGREAKDRHVGDLGNVKADAKGVAEFEFTDPLLKLSGPRSIVGRGLIVHAKEDDEKTQPTGDAGGRVGGGIIGIADDSPPKKK
jgi:Cu-Zn family superoxide dismutase